MLSDVTALVSFLKFDLNTWNALMFLYKGDNFNFKHLLAGLKLVGISFLIFNAAIYIIQTKYNIVNNGKIQITQPIMAFIAIGAFLAVPGLYENLCTMVYRICLGVQNMAAAKTMAYLEMNLQDLFQHIAGNSTNLITWFQSYFDIITPLGFLTICSITFTIILMHVLPFVQAVYFTFYFLIGPLLLPWAMNESFSKVYSFWWRQLVASSFIGVMCWTTFSVISGTQLLNNLNGNLNNHTISLFYSLATNVLLLVSASLSYSIFRTQYSSLSRGARALRRYTTMGLL